MSSEVSFLASQPSAQQPSHNTQRPTSARTSSSSTPSMPTSQIQATVDAIANQQVSNQFGTATLCTAVRAGHLWQHADPLDFPGGLLHRGRRPGRIAWRRGHQRSRRCLQPVLARRHNCIALDNFWRSLSNLTINVAGATGCQATPSSGQSPRPHRCGASTSTAHVSLMDYCTPARSTPVAVSSPTHIPGGTVINGSQQQFYVRNSNWMDGPTASGTRSSRVIWRASAELTRIQHPTPRWRALRSAARSPSSTRTRRATTMSSCRRCSATRSGPTWSSGTTAGKSLPDQQLLYRHALDRRAGNRPCTPARQEPDLDAGRVRAEGSRFWSCTRTPSCSVSASPTLVPQTGQEAITVADVDGVNDRGPDHRCRPGELAGADGDGPRVVGFRCRAAASSRT